MILLSNKKIVALLAFLCVYTGGFAQSSDTPPPVEMAEGLYQSGKIYVVIIAIALIFVGIIAYLVMLDRKIGKLEDELKKS